MEQKILRVSFSEVDSFKLHLHSTCCICALLRIRYLLVSFWVIISSAFLHFLTSVMKYATCVRLSRAVLLMFKCHLDEKSAKPGFWKTTQKKASQIKKKMKDMVVVYIYVGSQKIEFQIATARRIERNTVWWKRRDDEKMFSIH